MNINPKLGAVIITGASTGIGKTTALHLERLGFSVFATVRNERDAQALCSEASGRLVTLLMDGDAGLAGLVNNAGVGFLSPLEFVPLDELRWLFEVNFFGLLAVTQSFLPLLRQRRGRIVNISSTASIFIVPFHGPYSTSKLGVNGLSDALRLELKPHGVQVSLVVCGSIKTPMWEKGSYLSERVSKSFPPQALDIYGEHYNRLREYFFRLGKVGVPPEAVSKQITHALTARRAKNTYYVGSDAKFYNIASKLLYGRLRDWAIMLNIK
jgi:short-subunit dehydrogenase